MRIKKITSVFCLALLIFCVFTACSTQEPVIPEPQKPAEPEKVGIMKAYTPDEQHVKMLGRTYLYNDTLWLAMSGTGAEFSFTGKKAQITLVGDNVAKSQDSQDNYARIAIYINGKRVIDDIINEPEKTYTALDSETAQSAVIQVIKLSESAMSTVGIKQISADSIEDIQPGKANEHRIEFIGDSITCGYGIDDEDKDHHFSTSSEDVTKAYAYKTALALNADYSMFCLSGYGIISGYTDNPEIISTQLIPPYYESLGFSYGKLADTIEVSSIEWDFTKYTPDLIVINLGTNDDSYCTDDTEKQAEYTRKYVDFLKQIRAKNPSSKILCTLGIMGDRLYPHVEKAVIDYTAQTGDRNIAAMEFNEQLLADGYSADWHPTVATNSKAADKLIGKIKTLMSWH